MKKKKEKILRKRPEEIFTDLGRGLKKEDSIKKGYNEQNPSQPYGAFKPDAVDKKK